VWISATLVLPPAKIPEEFGIGMFDVKHELPKRVNMDGTCPLKRPSTDLTGLLFRDLLGRLHPVQRDQPVRRSVRGMRRREENWPADHLRSTLPVLGTFEPGIAGDKVLEERMELILCPETELERIHERDEALVSQISPRIR
jgi:hypothetical protein